MDKHYLYEDVKNLKYWVHAILPLVYDDSLSYYEVLAKVSAKMNEVIEQLNKNSEQIDKVTEFTVTSIENLTQAFNNFQAAMLERQDNFEKKLLKDVADWEEQLMADIDEWEKGLKEEINQWETNFTNQYNQWKTQLESDIAKWEKQLKADNDKWKNDTENDITTWKNGVLSELDTWKSNADDDIARWKQEAEQGLDTWKSQAESDINRWKSEIESTIESWKESTSQELKESLDTFKSETETELKSDIESWKQQVESDLNTWKQNFQGEQSEWESDVQRDLQDKIDGLSDVYVPKSDVVQSTGQSTSQIMSQKAVTDELSKKASAVVFIDNTVIPTINGVNTYENTNSELFNSIPNSYDSGILYFHNSSNDNYGSELIIPYNGGRESGVWYDTINSGVRQKAIRLAEQPDLEALTTRVDNISSELAGDYVPKSDVVQATGQSTTQVMSQKVVTDELGKKANSSDVTSLSNRVDNISSELAGDYVAKSDVVQAAGQSTSQIMSQKAVTDELNKKASQGEYTLIPQNMSGTVCYYNDENKFNNIPQTEHGCIVMRGVSTTYTDAACEIIIPFYNYAMHGVWYDVTYPDGRRPAIKLAEQPDLDSTNEHIGSLEEQINKLNAYGLKVMTGIPTSTTTLSDTRDFATYVLPYSIFKNQTNMPYVIHRITDDLSQCIFAFTCIPLAGGQNDMCEQTLTIYTPVGSTSAPSVFAMFKRYVQSMSAGRPIASESMWERVDNNVLGISAPASSLMSITTFGNGFYSMTPTVYNPYPASDKPTSLPTYNVGGRVIIQNICLTRKISALAEEWTYEQRLTTSSDSNAWTRTVTFDGENYSPTPWYKINMTAD